MGDYAKQRATIYGVLGAVLLLAGVGVTVGTYEIAKKSGGKGNLGCNSLPALQAFSASKKLIPVSAAREIGQAPTTKKFFGGARPISRAARNRK